MSDAGGPDPLAGMGGGAPGGAAGLGGMGGGQQPSEEQVRAAMGQMRATPVDQFVAGGLQELLTAAQVKLGRNDGRLLLDLVAVLNDATRGQVDEQLTTQVDDALSQLRMAQVQAEREIVNAATEGHVEQNDLPRRPAPIELKEREQPADDAADTAPDAPDAGAAASGQPTDVPDEARRQAPPQSGGQSGSNAASRLWVPGR